MGSNLSWVLTFLFLDHISLACSTSYSAFDLAVWLPAGQPLTKVTHYYTLHGVHVEVLYYNIECLALHRVYQMDTSQLPQPIGLPIYD